VLFGSWARGELSRESDDDWAVIVESGDPNRPDVRRVLTQAREALGGEGREPGEQDLFGVAFTGEELIDQIGLDEDLNRRLTRRILLLLESVPLVGAESHRRSWELVLHTYLAHGAKSYRPPRFLLNRSEMFDYLRRQLRASPTDRLAEAFLHFDGGVNVDAGIRGLQAYDRFVGLMASEDFRLHLKTLTADTRKASSQWREVSALGDQLQQSLLTLLFGSSLAPLTIQFGIF